MGFFEETNNEQVDNSLWVESYRPTTLENYVGNEHLKEKVSGYLESDGWEQKKYTSNGSGDIHYCRLRYIKDESDNKLFMEVTISGKNNSCAISGNLYTTTSDDITHYIENKNEESIVNDLMETISTK